MTEEPEETIEPEVMPPENKVELRRPSAPVTVDDLAAMRGEGEEIIAARVAILETLRKASIKSTKPQDWLLFRAQEPGGTARITGYLGDVGCQRIRPLWGIDIEPVGTFEKIAVDKEFAYSSKGDGYCKITQRAVKDIEGLRYTTDDFCKDLSPIMSEMRVRQAATANRDGNIVRELTGLNSVPIEELQAAGLDTDLCARGRGFGGRAERSGAKVQEAPEGVVAPLCEICNQPARFWPAGNRKSDGKPYPAFFSCPSKEHRWSMPLIEWTRILETQTREKKQEQQSERESNED